MSEPQPVVVKILCSLCDLDWPSHGEKPTTEDCIRLLKQELSFRPRPYQQFHQHYPYQISYGGRVDFNRPVINTTTNAVTEYRTPEVS